MKKQWFKKIDALVFQGVNHLRAHPKYQELLNFIDSLPEHQSKWITQGLSYFVAFIPLSLVLLTGIYSSHSQSEYKLLKEIHSQLHQINGQSKKIRLIEDTVIAQKPFHSQVDFKRNIQPLLHQNNISSFQVQFSDFNSKETKSNIIKSHVKMSFKELTTKELSQLLKGIMISHRIKVSHIEATLDPQSSLLKGILDLTSFSKSSVGTN